MIYSVLIVDDHPLIAEAYESAFNKVSDQDPNLNFIISKSIDCDSAIEYIEKFIQGESTLNIVVLDIRIPPSADGKMLSGEDLGIYINKVSPDTKIVVSTTLNDNYRVHNILKTINPDGFLIKNDINAQELTHAIRSTIIDPPYYSKSVIRLLRKQVSTDYLLDRIDRKLLYEISIGTRTKDLPDILPLSIAGIEKRKRQLKQTFNTETDEDKELIMKAKEKGFL
ncbi:response regulator [Psychroflexus gondwanensis]|jgi:DNA-binding NarL/FixJ family response regulator|uniref:response regulator n=1 Tax=Psychroflexus gondwanensis TaxID=251 RepID=UPI001CC1CF9B|nr:response regulator [Psychroflexus gondwanensis]